MSNFPNLKFSKFSNSKNHQNSIKNSKKVSFLRLCFRFVAICRACRAPSLPAPSSWIILRGRFRSVSITTSSDLTTFAQDFVVLIKFLTVFFSDPSSDPFIIQFNDRLSDVVDSHWSVIFIERNIKKLESTANICRIIFTRIMSSKCFSSITRLGAGNGRGASAVSRSTVESFCYKT